MTLFIRTPRRLLVIDDFYVMLVTFLISFAVTKIVKAVIEKQMLKNKNNTNMTNPRGGDLKLEFSDDTELAETILACIADNERYLIKDPELIKVIFNLVKAKIKNEVFLLTPNMIRFLALNLKSKDQTLIVKIGNIIASSNTRVRLLSRMGGSLIMGVFGALSASFGYSILMFLLYFNATENCYYKCSDYFEQLPAEGSISIYDEKSSGHLVIGGSDDTRQIEIYVPSQTIPQITATNNEELKTTKTYFKTRKTAKEIKFSDFRKTDPVLSSFKDLIEPEIPQKNCLINDVKDIIDIRVE